MMIIDQSLNTVIVLSLHVHICFILMVYVNNKKFACESCIKGHRSSSCHHTDRPLFEIKKKGRPVSQCEKCRELRQSKKLHSKCTCTHVPDPREVTQPLVSSSSSKTRRYIPIIPALPNGLKDVLTQSPNAAPADERQTVDSLLNPCNCKSLRHCRCKVVAKEKSPSRQSAITIGGPPALSSAAVAMKFLPSSSSSLPVLQGKPAIRPRSPALVTQMFVNKRKRHETKSYDHLRSPNILLPPILYTERPSTSSPLPHAVTPVPDFDFMPPIEQIASLAGSGCTCGVRCACPGCVEHRGSDHTDHGRRNCAQGCGTCVDPNLEFSLPMSTSAGSLSPYFYPRSSNTFPGAKETFLDRFFARAAALPPPPEHRKTSVIIDPMDTTVYHNIVGPVGLPRLECCGGVCSCPEGQCSCRPSCQGCSSDKAEKGIPALAASGGTHVCSLV